MQSVALRAAATVAGSRCTPRAGRQDGVADGDGWTECALGHRHWGRFGAAGLLAVAPGAPYVLLQHRAPWSHGGDTWGVPGGARDRGRDRRAGGAARDGRGDLPRRRAGRAARRARRRPRHLELHDARRHASPARLPVVPERESVDLRWVAVDEVDRLPLHAGFAGRTLAALRARLRDAREPLPVARPLAGRASARPSCCATSTARTAGC